MISEPLNLYAEICKDAFQTGEYGEVRKNIGFFLPHSIKNRTFAPAKSRDGAEYLLGEEKSVGLNKQRQWIDLLAQLVEHNTFNVGVMGSSPIQVTIFF